MSELGFEPRLMLYNVAKLYTQLAFNGSREPTPGWRGFAQDALCFLRAAAADPRVKCEYMQTAGRVLQQAEFARAHSDAAHVAHGLAAIQEQLEPLITEVSRRKIEITRSDSFHFST